MQVIGGRLFLPEKIAERFQRHIDADLVAVSEAVNDRPRRISHVHRDPFDIPCDDAAFEIRAGEANEAERRIFDLRKTRLPVDGHPDFKRELGGEAVKLERGKKADDPMRNPAAGFGEAVILRDVGVREDIKPPGWSLQNSVGHEPCQIDTRNGVFLKVHGTENTSLPSQVDKPALKAGPGVPSCWLMYHPPTLWNTSPRPSNASKPSQLTPERLWQEFDSDGVDLHRPCR
jgi:hypothetical protein